MTTYLDKILASTKNLRSQLEISRSAINVPCVQRSLSHAEENDPPMGWEIERAQTEQNDLAAEDAFLCISCQNALSEDDNVGGEYTCRVCAVVQPGFHRVEDFREHMSRPFEDDPTVRGELIKPRSSWGGVDMSMLSIPQYADSISAKRSKRECTSQGREISAGRNLVDRITKTEMDSLNCRKVKMLRSRCQTQIGHILGVDSSGCPLQRVSHGSAQFEPNVVTQVFARCSEITLAIFSAGAKHYSDCETCTLQHRAHCSACTRALDSLNVVQPVEPGGASTRVEPGLTTNKFQNGSNLVCDLNVFDWNVVTIVSAVFNIVACTTDTKVSSVAIEVQRNTLALQSPSVGVFTGRMRQLLSPSPEKVERSPSKAVLLAALATMSPPPPVLIATLRRGVESFSVQHAFDATSAISPPSTSTHERALAFLELLREIAKFYVTLKSDDITALATAGTSGLSDAGTMCVSRFCADVGASFAEGLEVFQRLCMNECFAQLRCCGR